MLRKLFFVLVLLGFIGALAYSYFHFKTIKQPVSNAIKAIPTSAALILESKQVSASWKKINETNLIWQELVSTETFNNLDRSIEYLDSLRKRDKNFDAFLKQQSLFVSIHMSGSHDYDFLFTLGLPPTLSEDDVASFINQTAKKSQPQTKVYDGVKINTITSGDEKFHYAVHQGILSGSHSMILVEDAIRQTQAKNSLVDIADFEKVMHTAGDKIDANIFVNYKVFPNILNTLLQPKYHTDISGLTNIANWSEVDLDLVPNAIKLNGYTYANDSINNYMNTWLNQAPQSVDMVKMLPQNVSTFIHLGFSDFNQYQKDYQIYLEKNNKLFEHGAALKMVESKYGIDLTKDFLDHIDNEMALVITEATAETYKNSAQVVFKMKNIEKSMSSISKIDTSIDLAKELSSDTVSYNGYYIQQLNLSGLFDVLFGSPFSIVEENYYTVIGSYLVFANSVNSLRDFINNYERSNTLARDVHFANFMENLNNKSNILVYSNISNSADMYKAFVSDELSKGLDEHQDMLKKFEASAIQISRSKNNLFYNNVYLNHNPIERKETSSLWETELDTSISRKPELVINHNSFEKEVFIQDDANTIYLINNTGKVLWKKKIDGPILGNVTQIDIYKNKKLQLMFNTESKLHLIDRNGENVTGYPIDIKAKSSAPVSVMDYDKNKNYRILLPTKDGKVLNFEASGKQVDGWEFKGDGAPITQLFEHIMINGKDYIISIGSNGKIHALNRRGEERLKLTETVPVRSFSIEKAQTLGNTYLLSQDTSGVIRVYLDNRKETTRIPKVYIETRFYYSDINSDQKGDYLLVDDNELRVLNQELKQITEYEVDSPITTNIFTYQLPDDVTEIGFSSTGSNEIYLLNDVGMLHQGFPLYGSTAFTIGDMNKDGQMELVVGSKDGHVYAYTLE